MLCTLTPHTHTHQQHTQHTHTYIHIHTCSVQAHRAVHSAIHLHNKHRENMQKGQTGKQWFKLQRGWMTSIRSQKLLPLHLYNNTHTHTHTVGHLHHKEAIPIIPTDEGFHCRQGKVEHSGCVHKEKGRKESHSQWQRSITLLGCSNQLQIHNYNLLLLLLCPLNLRCDVCCRAFDTLDRKLNKKKNRN